MGFFDLHEPEDGQDRFFLYAMVILPFCATGSYLFDAWYHFRFPAEERTYEGLLSTIMIVFYYLQYYTPIRSKTILAIYFILLCITKEAATIGYLIYYTHKGDTFKIIYYSCILIIDLSFTIGLLYCRIYHSYQSHIAVENKHLFHFMSRLEVILTIFIPAYMNIKYSSLTRNTIAFFLLFDFFSDSYSKFQGIWIKSALYLFVITTTISVASEWFYFNQALHAYEELSYASELAGAILCDSIIILQFFPFHFKPTHVRNIFRLGFNYKQKLDQSNGVNSIGETLSPSKSSDLNTMDEETPEPEILNYKL